MTRHNDSVLILLSTTILLAAIGIGATASAQVARAADGAPKAAVSGNTAQPPSAAPAIEPRVGEVLGRACSLLKTAKTVSYHAEIVFDSVLPSLVKLQYAGAMDVAIERPNRLAISYESDLGAKQIWYEDDTLTVFDPAHRAYAVAPAPDSIDAMLAFAEKKKNLTIPLAGFDVSDPCKRAAHDVIHSKYVGINDVNKIECDHLAFFLENADWQLWVEHGVRPLPRKIVITYKGLPTQPQWSAIFSEWRLNEPLNSSVFRAKLPATAIKTQFVELKEQP